MRIERREFLKLLGGMSGAVIVGSAGVAGVDQFLDVPDEVLERIRSGPGIETWKNTICGQCSGGCGIRVRLIDGVPVYIRGNPLHPVNQGGMCPLGHSAIEVLFNPDRAKRPLQRVGPVGSGKWDAVDWEQALQRVTTRLSSLREAGKPHQIAFLGGYENGLMQQHIARFMRSYGSPNYYQLPAPRGNSTANRLALGRHLVSAPDIANARLIVSFGSNFLEEGHSPVYYTKLYSRLRDLVGTDRARFVQVEPRMGLTASNADRWIPIKPGTYGALALGIAFVLIREELIDPGFVRDFTFGFETWTDPAGKEHTGFRDHVLADYYPERVSEITGVPSETILELGRDIGINRPSVVLGGEGVIDNTNGTYAQLAIQSINALLGNFGKEGGIVFPEPPPLFELPTVAEDDVAKAGNRMEPLVRGLRDSFPFHDFSIDELAKNVASGQPYPIELLFLYGGNCLFELPGHHQLRMALERVPFVVSFDSFITETSEYADLILPDHASLEKWDEVSEVPSIPFSQVGIRQPVIEPIHDTRHSGDVLISLAKTLSDSMTETFSFASYEEMIQVRARGLYESGEGAIASGDLKDTWLQYLRQRGWYIGSYSSFGSFWSELLERGAWWNPVRAETDPQELFSTPSSKYEFYAQTVNDLIGAIPAHGQSLELDDTSFLPHHESLPPSDEPLHLITFQMLTNRNGFGSNQPMMQEMFGYQARHYWRSWVELHPTTAEVYGVSDGDWLWVQSVVGSVRLPAKVVPSIVPGVLAIPFGLGHTSYGRYAAGHGVNPHAIMKSLYDPLSGRPALRATRVSISRAT